MTATRSPSPIPDRRTRRTAALAGLAVAVLATVGCAADEDVSVPADPRPSPPGPACDLGAVPEEPDPEVARNPVEFGVDGTVATMTGTIGADVVHRTCDLVERHPAVTTIEMLDVPGSSTEGDQTLDAGLVVHDLGLATLVPGDGQVESGGVDYFLAGTTRVVEDGACLGVHATGIDEGEGTVSAADLPRDDPEHTPYLEYFRRVGIPEDFYWFTLSAAPPEGIHYLTPDEMVEFRVVTGEPPGVPCPLADQ